MTLLERLRIYLEENHKLYTEKAWVYKSKSNTCHHTFPLVDIQLGAFAVRAAVDPAGPNHILRAAVAALRTYLYLTLLHRAFASLQCPCHAYHLVVCIGPADASCPSLVAQLAVAVVGTVVGTVVGIVEASHLDSCPYSCLHPFQPCRFLASQLPEVWLFVVDERTAAFVDNLASPVDRTSQGLPYELPYYLRHTVGLPFQTCGASEFAAGGAGVVVERGPSPFRRPLVRHRSFHGITTGGGRPRASLCHHSQARPYLAEYETPSADLVLAAASV